ncbi:MAG: DUF4301 domain-containing protein [Bacteroidetes bacterium HGW-Bacteroidetes-7]|jgi:hypothetical protein|nr:MAG: DUF4301 domain-containing protein [Bacteroidetes bacterium HGW-Bacteroidetes-7]
MFSSKDYDQMAQSGINREVVLNQIETFKKGFPYLEVVSAATPKKGVKILSESEKSTAIQRCSSFEGTICKFVPASGAATRMFKELYDVIMTDNEHQSENNPLSARFLNELKRFPFYEDLKVLGAFTTDNKLDIIRKVLNSDGLNYGQLPKGLLKFHRYQDETRTPFEEHLIEAAQYARSKQGVATITFTVSPEHIDLFKKLAEKVEPVYQKRYGCKFDILFTTQKKSTDTIAVDPENKPFRLNDSSLLFRPAGHGALIENLNDMDYDIVIIKNIDNIPMERYLDNNSQWKKILTGVLLEIRDKLFAYLHKIENEYSEHLAEEIYRFFSIELSTELPKVPDTLIKDYLWAKLDRPVRVCGVVKNLGEPGGGPFLVRDSDGSVSPQILEGAQLNLNDKKTIKTLSESTHFNPVDIVCSFKDHEGERFNLKLFTDPETGFISEKSQEGRKLKALELPGLWNGAMSNWNTVFVEVPVSTFSPVKTVFDLLREEHQ